jgi:hypothetical protein
MLKLYFPFNFSKSVHPSDTDAVRKIVQKFLTIYIKNWILVLFAKY